MNTLTPDTINSALAKAKADAERVPAYVLRQGLRTLLHEALQAVNPTPFSALPPEMQAQRERRKPLMHAEKASHYAHQLSQLTEAHHEAFGKARAEGSKSAIGCSDALHFHQKLHGTALWEEADRIADATIGGITT